MTSISIIKYNPITPQLLQTCYLLQARVVPPPILLNYSYPASIKCAQVNWMITIQTVFHYPWVAPFPFPPTYVILYIISIYQLAWCSVTAKLAYLHTFMLISLYLIKCLSKSAFHLIIVYRRSFETSLNRKPLIQKYVIAFSMKYRMFAFMYWKYTKSPNWIYSHSKLIFPQCEIWLHYSQQFQNQFS